MGLISRVAEGMPVEKSVNVTYRSVMGCELPKVTLDPPDSSIPYGFENTDGNVDVAYISFGRVKQMTAMLAEVDNSVFRLANAIKKTQTRANALKTSLSPDMRPRLSSLRTAWRKGERRVFKAEGHQEPEGAEEVQGQGSSCGKVHCSRCV